NCLQTPSSRSRDRLRLSYPGLNSLPLYSGLADKSVQRNLSMSLPSCGHQVLGRRKWTGRLILGLLGLLFSVVGLYVYFALVPYLRLERAIAEVDRLDPGWRLEELERRRAILPDEKNSGVRVLNVQQLIPRGWLNSREPTEEAAKYSTKAKE